MLGSFTDSASKRGGISAKGMYIMRRFIEEALEEAKDFPEELLEGEMVKASMMVYWVATGKIPDNAADDIIALISQYAPEYMPENNEIETGDVLQLESVKQ